MSYTQNSWVSCVLASAVQSTLSMVAYTEAAAPCQASPSLQNRGNGPAEIGTLFHDDVVTLVSVQLPRHALLTASPPCQPWSTANKSGALGPEDDRAQSLQTIPWLLRKHGPAGGMFEQVEGLLAFQSRGRYDVNRPGPSYEDFASKCHNVRVTLSTALPTSCPRSALFPYLSSAFAC